MNRILAISLTLGLLVGFVSPRGFAQATLPFEPGGSVYFIWDAGQALADNGKDPYWYTANGVKPVIGTYHLNPGEIQNQLAQMYSAGQRKIALILHYAWLGDTSAPDYVHGHIVDLSLGRLRPIHQQNLKSLLINIEATGFTEIYFRFAPEGNGPPLGQADINPRHWGSGMWTNTMETTYQLEWTFISSTISGGHWRVGDPEDRLEGRGDPDRDRVHGTAPETLARVRG